MRPKTPKKVVPVYGIKPSTCRTCGKVLSAHAGNDLPKAGDISICLGCCTVSVFNDDFTVRAPRTVEEIQDCEEALADLKAEAEAGKGLT